MPSSQAPNTGLNYGWALGESGWNLQMDENLLALDMLTQMEVISRSIGVPPAAPAAGDRYIVPAGASGVWTGLDGKVVRYNQSAWEVYTPKTGWRCVIQDENSGQGILVRYDGSQWVGLPTTAIVGSNLGNADLNTAITSGFYKFEIPSANGPGFDYGQLIVSRQTDTCTQIAGNSDTGNLWTRSAGGVGSGSEIWTPWSMLLTSSNGGGSPVAVGNAVATNQAVPLGQSDNRYLLSGADGSSNTRYLTASTTLTVADSGKLLDCWGAAAPITLTLPPPQKGLKFHIIATNNSNVVSIVAPVPIYIPGSPANSANTPYNLPTSATQSATLEAFANGSAYRLVMTSGNVVVNPAFASNQAVNLGQADGRYLQFRTITDQTANRLAAATYTNSTGKPVRVEIMVYASSTVGAGYYAQLTVTGGGVTKYLTACPAFSGAAGGVMLSSIVPPNGTYQVTLSDSTVQINKWYETV